MMELDGPRQPPADGGPARALVVLLHGYGADGNDLIGLAPYWSRALPHVEFVSPHAPFPCEMAPFGRQWFSLADRGSQPMLAGTRLAAQLIDGFLDDELARTGLAAGALALVGFSQGTMMSLFVGPRRADPIAGILGFSGRLIAPELLPGELRSRCPVSLVHGDSDEMVPASELAAAVAGLETAGFDVSSRICRGLGHSIDETGLRDGLAFLHRVLPGPG